MFSNYDRSIQTCLSISDRLIILEQCLSITPKQHEIQNILNVHEPYFRHYEDLCQSCPAHDTGRLTHAEMCKAAKLAGSEGYTACIEALKRDCRFPELRGTHLEAFVKRWLTLATQALLLIDTFAWYGEVTLSDYLDSYLAPDKESSSSGSIGRSFNLRNLERVGGLAIRWTNIISEHLTLENNEKQIDGRQLAVFHNRAVLQSLSTRSTLYPAGLIEEIRLTLDLLLPKFDQQSTNWYRTHVTTPKKRAPGSAIQLDPSATQVRILTASERDLRSFKWFRGRLVEVKELYDAHKPQTLYQHLIDDRDPSRKWGFIIAFLVFIFGMAQTIEGAIQCYKAYHPS